MAQVKIFSGFERFWHWAQTLLVFGLMLTGFEIHGTYALFGFEQALDIHLVCAWTLIGLWVLAIFWHFTTGEWRQYVPSHKGVLAMALYYGYGMFSGETKPFVMTRRAKHNPLQRLAYFGFKVAIAPAIWISGLLLMFYATWQPTGLGAVLPLTLVSWFHVAAAFALILFLIVHIYLAATTGHPWYSYLRAMISGYEELEEDKSSAS